MSKISTLAGAQLLVSRAYAWATSPYVLPQIKWILCGLILGLLIAAHNYKTQIPDWQKVRDILQARGFVSVTLQTLAPFWECGIGAYSYSYFYGRVADSPHLLEGVACEYLRGRTTISILVKNEKGRPQ